MSTCRSSLFFSGSHCDSIQTIQNVMLLTSAVASAKVLPLACSAALSAANAAPGARNMVSAAAVATAFCPRLTLPLSGAAAHLTMADEPRRVCFCCFAPETTRVVSETLEVREAMLDKLEVEVKNRRVKPGSCRSGVRNVASRGCRVWCFREKKTS